MIFFPSVLFAAISGEKPSLAKHPSDSLILNKIIVCGAQSILTEHRLEVRAQAPDLPLSGQFVYQKNPEQKNMKTHVGVFSRIDY